MLTKGVWRPIPGFEGRYEINIDGDVRSLPRTVVRRNMAKYRVKERILKQQPVRRGSEMVKVTLSVNGIHHDRLVHLLVKSAFGEHGAA